MRQSAGPRAGVFKPTVNDIAADVKLGTVDAGLVFDAVAKQFPELEIVTLPELAAATAAVSVAVLRQSAQPTAALRFARYLSAADRGLKQFAAHGYTVTTGDAWEETPEILFYSGAVEVIKLLTGIGQPLAGVMLVMNLDTWRIRQVKPARDPRCPVCAGIF